MNKIYTLLLVAISYAMPASAKDEKPKEAKKPMTQEDSVFKHYMREGAWRSPLFSRERERHIDSALAILPQNAYLWQQRSMPLIKQNKYEAAAPFLDSAAKYNPAEYVPYRAFSKCIFSKEYRAAIADFDLARSINGNFGVMDHPYDFFTGLCYLQLNQFDSAEHYVRKCIDHSIAQNGENWVHYVHWFYLGVIRFEQEDYKGAITYLDKSLKEFPDFCDAEYYKATALARMKDYQQALPIIRKAKQDFDKGYTMNEDNVYYETYPYQVKKFFMNGAVASLEDEVKSIEK
jgi:tetratricopeptide (TPR) repeat protein